MSITLDRIQFYVPPAPRSSQVINKGTEAHLTTPTHPQRLRRPAPALRENQLSLTGRKSARDAIDIDDDSANDTSSSDSAAA